MDTDGNIVYHPQQQLIYSDLKTENTALIAKLDDGGHVDGKVIYTVQLLDNGRWKAACGRCGRSPNPSAIWCCACKA